jgi:DNA-binding NtrC family response regulator
LETVLVIEDDHDIRVSLRETLESEGFYVFSAANGIDGMATLKRIKRPDVIILDQNMPLMNGDQFLEIKSKDPDIASIPVIVMSAVPCRVAHLDVKDFVSKPVDLDRLLRAIRKLCTESSRNRTSST